MALTPGTRLGVYEVIAQIGAGGMGEVYRARDTKLNRDVAVKILPDAFASDPDRMARFKREAQILASLNHPHIAMIYGVEESGGVQALVLELVEGTPLAGPLPAEKALEYAGQILDALDAAHRTGITHRDLKPANILVSKRAGIKLLDFGVARVAPTAESPTRSQTLAVVGTPAYMAPEQWEGKPADARSDLYAFGCVLFEMLTGTRPSRERRPLEPAALESVVSTCLELDPDDRWQSARDLKRALVGALQRHPVVRTRRATSLLWIGAVMLAVAGSLGGWALFRARPVHADVGVLRVQIEPPEGGQFVFGTGVGGIAVSPDGRTAAYVVTTNGRTALWVRRFDGTAARLLAGTDNAAFPFWSPDGQFLAFFERAGNTLQRVDLTGGAPLKLCDANGQGGTWSDDGRIIFATTGRGLAQVPVSGGTSSPLTTLAAGETAHFWPQMLPGGHFLYFARSGTPENTGLYVASLAKPNDRVRLLNSSTKGVYAPAADGRGFLLWQRDGTLMAQAFDALALRLSGEPFPLASPVGTIGPSAQVNVAASGAMLLYDAAGVLIQFSWFDRTGRSLGVAGEPGQYGPFHLSPDGRRIAVARGNAGGGVDLWLLELARGVASKFTFAPGYSYYPVWSPGSGAIMFASSRPQNLFRQASSGPADVERVTQSAGSQIPTDWSRDGRFVLYEEGAAETKQDIWILPVTLEGKQEAGAGPRRYLHSAANESSGRFSPEPNPRWVAYQSDESGRPEVYIQAFPEPRGQKQISTGGGRFPQWGPGRGAQDRDLFYVSPDNKLMAVDVKLGAETVEPSEPRALFSFPSIDTIGSPYDVTPDGQRFLVRTTPTRGSPLTLIVNWPSLLQVSNTK